MKNPKQDNLFSDNQKLSEIVEKIMKTAKPIRKYDNSQYDNNDIIAILAILQKRVDEAMEAHPGEPLERYLEKDIVEQYTVFQTLATMRGITIPPKTVSE